MWLIVGLGNPGKRYAGNRHNAGFMVVDELVRRHSFGALRKVLPGCEQSNGLIAGERATLLKPMEFMNLSGFAVSRAVQYLSVEHDKVVVIHDEADLPFARLRLKSGGGHGGHNGLRSISEQLGGGDYLRVRVGVGKPQGVSGGGSGDKRVANYLLSDFSSSESGELRDIIDRACDATEHILKDGIRSAMNQFNGGGTADKA